MAIKSPKIEDLNILYSEAESVDQEHFAHERSNLLLVAGDHYSSKKSRYWNRIRESRDIPADQKLRLTKNHIQKITKNYTNNITTYAPSVKVMPHNEKELKDVKSAQLNDSVWQDVRTKHKLRLKTIEWAGNFIDIGEVGAKIFWDTMAGKYLGEEPVPALDPETGEPQMDEMGQPVHSGTRPKFSGDFVFEKLYGFNLLRSPRCQYMGDGQPWCVRKLVDINELKEKIGDDEEKLKYVQEASKNTFDVFEAGSAGYNKVKDQVLLREWYWPPSVNYPNGYFVIATEYGKLWEDELPFGIWPIAFEGCDDIPMSPRKRGIVRVLRPNQIEINRAASKMAEHQVTLGDDKMLIQSGSNVTNGGQLSGVRTFQYTGTKPDVMPGRSGNQYLDYMLQNIKEMYELANMELDVEKQGAATGAVDPFAMLYQSLRNKKRFSIYAEKFEGFLIQVCEIVLAIAKNYYSEAQIIPAIGRDEIVNIAEFKNSEESCYQIKLEPLTDDIETLMGKQLVLNHILQYVGPQMKPEDIGTVLAQLPFGNWKEAFKQFTLKSDRATNFILALDRGEQPQPNKYDDAKYMLSHLVDRTTQADFQYMNPQIQQMYAQMIQQYETQADQEVQEIMRAEKGFIPSGGPRVKADIYVPNATEPSRTERATFPTEALVWLSEQLAKQGSTQEILQQMNTGAVSEMAGQIDQQQASQFPVDPSTTIGGQPYPQGALQ